MIYKTLVRFFQIFSLRVPSPKDSTFGYSSASHIASSKKAFVKLLTKCCIFVQISSEHFLISIASKSTLHFWTGIDWTLPRHQHSFTSSTFLPLITSTSHSSIISHCPSVNLLRLDICQPTRSCDDRPEEDFEFVVQSEMFLKNREISTSESPANGEVITC